jgi:hypothetical protein
MQDRDDAYRAGKTHAGQGGHCRSTPSGKGAAIPAVTGRKRGRDRGNVRDRGNISGGTGGEPGLSCSWAPEQ